MRGGETGEDRNSHARSVEIKTTYERGTSCTASPELFAKKLRFVGIER
jgi:hypothetical protein